MSIPQQARLTPGLLLFWSTPTPDRSALSRHRTFGLIISLPRRCRPTARVRKTARSDAAVANARHVEAMGEAALAAASLTPKNWAT
jgi:hypothetical protein